MGRKRRGGGGRENGVVDIKRKLMSGFTRKLFLKQVIASGEMSE